MSPYHSFGHVKFVPVFGPEVLTKILKSNPLWNDSTSLYKSVIEELLPQVETEIFNRDKPYTVMNFPEEEGVTGYFSRNITKADLALIREFLVS
jgi:hypothetical protein